MFEEKDLYYTVFSWMTTELGLTGIELNLFALIHNFSRFGNLCTLSLTSYEKFLGVSRKCIIAHLKSLIDKGFIGRYRFKNGIAYYAIYSKDKVSCYVDTITFKDFETIIKEMAEEDKNKVAEFIKEKGFDNRSLYLYMFNNKLSLANIIEFSAKKKAVIVEKKQNVTSTEMQLRNCSEKVFGSDFLAETFYPAAEEFCKKIKIPADDVEDYFTFVESKLRQKENVNNLPGMFRTLFLAQDIYNAYQSQKEQEKKNRLDWEQKEKELESRKETCKVCGESYIRQSYMAECPHCKSRFNRLNDQDYVNRQKEIIRLSPEAKEAYENESRNMYLELINSGIPRISQQFDLELEKRQSEINDKYGLK